MWTILYMRDLNILWLAKTNVVDSSHSTSSRRRLIKVENRFQFSEFFVCSKISVFWSSDQRIWLFPAETQLQVGVKDFPAFEIASVSFNRIWWLNCWLFCTPSSVRPSMNVDGALLRPYMQSEGTINEVIYGASGPTCSFPSVRPSTKSLMAPSCVHQWSHWRGKLP